MKRLNFTLSDTIFDLESLSKEEKMMTCSPSSQMMLKRLTNKEPFENIDRLLSYEEYMQEKSHEDMVYDLFLVMRNRGLFEEARRYELLAGHDAIEEFESSFSDLFLPNEYEYYKWRKEH